MCRFVIIGAGEAGTRAAVALRDAGKVTLIGAEPHQPYERPPLSKPTGAGVTIRAIADTLEGIDARLGVRAVAIDREARTVRLSDGTAATYDRLLIATGARPRMLPCFEGDVAVPLRTRSDAEAIFSRARPGVRAIIFGAGLIGLELAAAFRQIGLAVTVLEAAPRAMGRVLPAQVADELVDRHRKEGVDVRFGIKTDSIAPGRVTLQGGETLDADLVIAAIGVTPETALAEAAGLPCANGVVTDAGLRTMDAQIFAAGDCAAIDHPHYGRFRFESWRSACDQGVLAARAMMGEKVAFALHPWFWSDQYDLGLQMIGLHDPKRRVVRRHLEGGSISFELDDRGILRAACGLGPGVTVAKDIRLAEMMIEKAASPAPDALEDRGMSLKALLRAA